MAHFTPKLLMLTDGDINFQFQSILIPSRHTKSHRRLIDVETTSCVYLILNPFEIFHQKPYNAKSKLFIAFRSFLTSAYAKYLDLQMFLSHFKSLPSSKNYNGANIQKFQIKITEISSKNKYIRTNFGLFVLTWELR